MNENYEIDVKVFFNKEEWESFPDEIRGVIEELLQTSLQEFMRKINILIFKYKYKI
jgi:TRAP-type mannitol/chloroaromatic compound transport system substrate-binding protein